MLRLLSLLSEKRAELSWQPPWCVPFTRSNECVKLTLLLQILQIAEAAYLVSRLAVLYGDSLRASTLMKEEMVFFALTGLLFAIAATSVGCACVLNFGKGLKPFLKVGANRQEPELSNTAYHLYPADANDPLAPQRASRRFILE